MATRTTALQVPAIKTRSLGTVQLVKAFRAWARKGALGNDGGRDLARYTGARC